MEGLALATALLTQVRLMNKIALQSLKWQLIGMIHWYCYHAK